MKKEGFGGLYFRFFLGSNKEIKLYYRSFRFNGVFSELDN